MHIHANKLFYLLKGAKLTTRSHHYNKRSKQIFTIEENHEPLKNILEVLSVHLILSHIILNCTAVRVRRSKCVVCRTAVDLF